MGYQGLHTLLPKINNCKTTYFFTLAKTEKQSHMPDLFNKLNLDFNIKIDFDIKGFKITRASFWVFSQLIICWHCNEKFLGFTLNHTPKC